MSESNRKTVLIVDDSRVARMMIRALILDKYPGWTCLEAGNGEEALAVLAGNSVDYFSVDLNMPGMDGTELIERLKPDYPNAKISLMTANVQDAVNDKAEELGILCTHKPINEESVGKMIAYFTGADSASTGLESSDSLETDLLGEMMNLGVGQAAAALSRIIKQEIKMSAPNIRFYTLEGMVSELGPNTPISVISQYTKGPFDAQSVLIFTKESGLEIVRQMLGENIAPEALEDVQQDALIEIGTVMLRACISAVSQTMGTDFELGVPSLIHTNPGDLLRSGTIDASSMVLDVGIDIRLSQNDAVGSLIFLLGPVTYDTLQTNLRNLLGKITGI